MSFCSIYDISLRHWWYPLRSTDGIINLRLLHGTSQEALFDFDDGGALLGLPVTECNFQGKYINAIWESYCCSLSLGFDLELNNFIVCLPTWACQSWFSNWFIVLYKHSWLLQVLENLVKLFGRFKKYLDRSTYSKGQTLSPWPLNLGIYCSVILLSPWFTDVPPQQWAVPRGADNICWGTKDNSRVCWTDLFKAMIRNSWLSLFQKDHRYYGYGDHKAIMREQHNIQTVLKYVSKPNALIFEIVAISRPCFSFR